MKSYEAKTYLHVHMYNKKNAPLSFYLSSKNYTQPSQKGHYPVGLHIIPGDLKISLLFAQVKHFINQDFLCHISGLTGYTARQALVRAARLVSWFSLLLGMKKKHITDCDLYCISFLGPGYRSTSFVYGFTSTPQHF